MWAPASASPLSPSVILPFKLNWLNPKAGQRKKIVWNSNMFFIEESCLRGSQNSEGDIRVPTPALPGSGSKGMISARFFQAPPNGSAKLIVKKAK
jgi:hypothetical protein